MSLLIKLMPKYLALTKERCTWGDCAFKGQREAVAESVWERNKNGRWVCRRYRGMTRGGGGWLGAFVLDGLNQFLWWPKETLRSGEELRVSCVVRLLCSEDRTSLAHSLLTNSMEQSHARK